jgi:hypothetical protein
MKIVVLHGYYGCDTGCCGHYIHIEDDEGNDISDSSTFEFDHPYGEDPLTWAKEFVESAYGEDHVKDLDWENCTIVDD